MVFAVLVPAACSAGFGSNGGRQGVPGTAEFARQQLGSAGWKVNTVLTGQSTGICGGRARRVVLDVSADQLHLSGGVALKHPHLSAWLFPHWQQAVACLKAYVRGSGAVPKPGNGVEQVFKTLGQTHVAEQVHGYFVLTSSNGSPAALKRASERAFAALGVGIA